VRHAGRAALGILGALALAGAACSRDASAPARAEGPLALVGAEPIEIADFRRAFARHKVEYRKSPAHEMPDWASLKRALLDQMIEQRMLLEEARRRGIEIPAAELDKALELARAGLDRDRFEETLLRTGQTLSEFRAALRERLLAEALFRQVHQGVSVDDAEARRRYDADPSRWAEAEAVRARHIAVRTEPEARKLWERIHNGASFEELARQHSVSPDRARGGDLGFFRRGEKPRVFEEVCFRLQPGQLSPVTVSEYGYHLFQVIERRPARPRTFEEAKGEVVAALRREKEQAAEEAFLRELRARTPVQVNDHLLQRVK
jgi:parvulin-like peptidyl-prolyl isomerase